MLGTGAWQNHELPNDVGDGCECGAGDATAEGGILILVTCEAFERASATTPESELSRDEKLTALAAGDGGRDTSSPIEAGE